MSATPTIIYTKTDEAPALATYSFLPIIQAFTKHTGIAVETRDISLAGRIIAAFPEKLTSAQQIKDDLAELGALTLKPEANIIKLPNVSASVPQLVEAITELQGKGYALPSFPADPKTDAEKDARARYDKLKGSAVNPVLREGNSDRRAPKAVKDYAKKHPHSMGKWAPDSKTSVATMGHDDFFSNEKSLTVAAATTVKIEFIPAPLSAEAAAKPGATAPQTVVLKEKTPLKAGEIFDGTFMSKKALGAFYAQQMAKAKQDGVLFSLHLKATMMKVSDPIMFGLAVRVFFKDLFTKHAAALAGLGVNLNNGFGDLVEKIKSPPGRPAGRHQRRHRCRLRRPPGRRHGQLRQWHHQPPRPERCHRGRLHARHDPRRRQDVRHRGQAPGHTLRHPRQLLRRRLPNHD
jgi:isocitrate dehydrogenase